MTISKFNISEKEFAKITMIPSLMRNHYHSHYASPVLKWVIEPAIIFYSLYHK